MKRIIVAAALATLIGAGMASAQIAPVPPADPGAGEGGGITPAPNPNTLPNAETQNDKEFRELMTGTWMLELPAPPDWRAYVEGAYNADGTFFLRQTSISPLGTSETTSAGTWKVKAIDRSNFTLTLTYTSPTNGITASDTLSYIDRNTLYSSRSQRNATRIR